MRRLIGSKIIIILLAITFMIVMPQVPVSALRAESDGDDKANLTLTLKTDEGRVCPGAHVTIYRVAGADLTSGLEYSLTDAFKDFDIDLYDTVKQSDIDELAKYAVKHDISGIEAVSSTAGTIFYKDLPAGAYLVRQTSATKGFSSFAPFMCYLPYYDVDEGYVFDVKAYPKIEYREPVKITVRKVWNDDGKSRPSSVKIGLYNEDGIFDTVTLDKDCNWQYEWENLDAYKSWKVREINVPRGYVVRYSCSDYVFTVTNTAKLIQTGGIERPIPILIFVGAFLVCAGIIFKVCGTRKNEEEE